MSGLTSGETFNPYRMFNGLFIPEGLARAHKISAGAKLAWGRLARYAGQDGKCYPSMKALGSELGVGARQAQNYVMELEKKKLVRRKSRISNKGQTSNEFEFRWHHMFEAGTKEVAGEGTQDISGEGTQDRSTEESQIEESHSEEKKTDLDCLPQNRKNGDSPSGVLSPSLCRRYPNVQKYLAGYMRLRGDDLECPSDRMVVDIMDAAGTHDQREVIAALKYLYEERGLKPFTARGPRSYAWFKTVLQDYFAKKLERDLAANPTGYHEWEGRNETRLSNAQFEEMTNAIEIPDAT